MRVVNEHLQSSKARLNPPKESGYLLMAAEVDRRPAILVNSRRKRRLLQNIRALVHELRRLDDVVDANVFDARLVAPGEGKALLRRRQDRVHRARYDVVVLIETASQGSAKGLRGHSTYRRLSVELHRGSRHTHEIAATNVRRIDDVDHSRDAVFLFNFFYADDPNVLVPVWEYTAGWFMDKTSLRDSTVLLPMAGEPDDYGIINHASWPSFRTFLPHLIFRPNFRRYVLANFAANNISAQPILYRIFRTSDGVDVVNPSA